MTDSARTEGTREILIPERDREKKGGTCFLALALTVRYPLKFVPSPDSKVQQPFS